MTKQVSRAEYFEFYDVLNKKIPAVLGKEVKVFNSIDKIGRYSIDSISNDGFFTYEYFKTLETQEAFHLSPIYVTVYEEGKLVAFAPCFIDLFNEYFYYGPKVRFITPLLQKIINFGHKVGFCQKQVLVCYSPFCSRSKVLFGKNSEEKMLLSLISDKIDEICKKQRILFSSFLFVSEFDEPLMKNLQNMGYLKSSGITTLYLDVQWTSFEDYLKSLKRSDRYSVRREIRKFRENGFTIEEPELGDFSAKLAELTANLHSKYKADSRHIFGPSLFSKLLEHSKDKIKVFVAKKNDEWIGFCLAMQQGDTLDCWICGFNYDFQTKKDFAYFNVTYYAPIQWAIENGYNKIYYRRMAEKAKLSRGCKPEKTHSFVKCHNDFLRHVINTAATNVPYSYLQPHLLKKKL